jgi:glycosyltransferase involved in cell wall biosynthesis
MNGGHTAYPLKILVIVKSVDGGTGTFLLNFLKIGKVFNNRKVILKTLVLEKPTYRNLSKYRFDFFRKKNFYPQHYSLAIRNFVGFFKEFFWIRGKINKFSPQIILAIDMRCNLLAVVCKIFSLGRLKVIATNHIDLGKTIFDKSTPYVNNILKIAIKFFYNQADTLVGVSKKLSKNLRKDFALTKDVVTVYNGLETKSQRRLPKRQGNKKIIITIARLVEQKDHDNLIKAFALLLKKMPKTELWILSNGPKRQELEILVGKLGMEKKIIFWGWVCDIKPFLAKSDLFVLSSKREGFAYSLLEAMRMGIPVISTDTPYGPGEILDKGKFGVLVPMGKPDRMRDAILKILGNKQKYAYYSKKSLERSKDFSIDKMLQSYKSLITKLAE